VSRYTHNPIRNYRNRVLFTTLEWVKPGRISGHTLLLYAWYPTKLKLGILCLDHLCGILVVRSYVIIFLHKTEWKLDVLLHGRLLHGEKQELWNKSREKWHKYLKGGYLWPFFITLWTLIAHIVYSTTLYTKYPRYIRLVHIHMKAYYYYIKVTSKSILRTEKYGLLLWKVEHRCKTILREQILLYISCMELVDDRKSVCVFKLFKRKSEYIWNELRIS